jgi:hypothetical protein
MLNCASLSSLADGRRPVFAGRRVVASEARSEPQASEVPRLASEARSEPQASEV